MTDIDVDIDIEDRSLEGAVVGGGESEAPLPMIVWLRGDEPHVADFCLDVEQVMAELGIRRSRLTQISGRELRVGRIRRGRYIAPVYRPEDVAAYKSWTRATSSHVKSSTVLNEAAASLRDESGRVSAALYNLAGDLSNGLSANAEATEKTVRGAVTELTPSLLEPLKVLQSMVAEQAAERRHEATMIETVLAVQSERLATIETILKSQASALLLLTKDLAELASLARVGREEAAAERAAAAAERAAAAAKPTPRARLQPSRAKGRATAAQTRRDAERLKKRYVRRG